MTNKNLLNNLHDLFDQYFAINNYKENGIAFTEIRIDRTNELQAILNNKESKFKIVNPDFDQVLIKNWLIQYLQTPIIDR